MFQKSNSVVVLVFKAFPDIKFKLKQANNHFYLLAIWGFMANFAR